MSIRSKPLIYSGFIHSLENQSDKSKFSKRYSRFKKRCHCRSLQQVVKVSHQYLSKERDVEDLQRVLGGLRMIKQEYPECSFLKKVMVLFNRRYRVSREKALISLDGTIQAYERKIRALEDLKGEDAENSGLEAKLEGNHFGNVVFRKGFTEAASAAVKRMAETGKLPPDEHIMLWKKELNALVKKFGSKEVDQDDLYKAVLLVGKEHVPRLIRQMDRIRREEPGFLFPDISRGVLNKQSEFFQHLAKAVADLAEDKIDLSKPIYSKPVDVAEEVDVLSGHINLEGSRAKKMVQQMWKDHRHQSSQIALNNLTIELLALFKEKKVPLPELANENNIERLAEIFVRALAKDEGDFFSAFAMLLEKSLRESELDDLNSQSQQVVESLIRAMQKYGKIDLSQVKNTRRSQALEMIQARIKIGFSRACNETKGIKKNFREEFLETVDYWKSREDFSDFSDRLLEASKKGGNAIRALIAEYIDDKAPDTDDSTLISALLYQLCNDDQHRFSQFVLNMMLIREQNPGLSHPFLDSLYQGIGFVGGVDLRNVSTIDEILILNNKREGISRDPDAEIFEENFSLFKEKNGRLAKMDPQSPQEGVEKVDIEDAKKLQKLFNHSEFKSDVEALLNEYLENDQLSSTENNRRRFIEKLIPITEKYLPVMLSEEAAVPGGDDLLPFIQALLAVSPSLGGQTLSKIAHEDQKVMGDVKSPFDYHFLTIFAMRDYFKSS
ncbi:hypothetical protein [Waddlia chondrophila]|uniref:Uncharacterized protein n=1 Tax=Waddlia chondrophila (strain ATCC VR-1470 / WSU 86-1044) TaxID=716544 RepID=D6YSZ5_WADCW|nr:hypothetical protein [Waddlia chondrophila]ADI39190.1 hypothetical protein wcw_1851 [Waddlia chondrophila WSU 86-1044]